MHRLTYHQFNTTGLLKSLNARNQSPSLWLTHVKYVSQSHKSYSRRQFYHCKKRTCTTSTRLWVGRQAGEVCLTDNNLNGIVNSGKHYFLLSHTSYNLRTLVFRPIIIIAYECMHLSVSDSCTTKMRFTPRRGYHTKHKFSN